MPMSPREQSACGIKRRRIDEADPEEDKEAKLHRKLHYALKELHKVVKKARTFEVQKTLKKLKDARQKDAGSQVAKDLESQVEALKHLQYDELAQSALLTKLKKDKGLSMDPSMQAILGQFTNTFSPGAPGTATAKVQSRILSSKILASEVVSIMQTLRTLLHPPMGSEDVRTADKGSHGSPNVPRRGTWTGFKGDVNSDEYEDASDNEAIAKADHSWESGTVNTSSESGDSVGGWADDRDSNSGDGADTLLEDGRHERVRLHQTEGKSEFFPSLSVGFARGDSDSEFSDSEAKLANESKRNRRGQRARRAIWERKFGKNANHIKKYHQPGSVPIDRRSGKGNSAPLSHRRTWSRAPTYSRKRISRPTAEEPECIKTSSSTGGHLERTQLQGRIREKQGGEPLHPSWEAKRKRKSANIVPSQGTKIVFSES